MLTPRGPLVITFIPGTSPALFGVACHCPPLKCTVFEFYGHIFHPLQFLSPTGVLHTLQKVTGLPCYFHSPLWSNSFVMAFLPSAPLLSLKPPPPPAPPGPSPGATPVLSGLSLGKSHRPYSPGAPYLSPSCSLEGESLSLQLPSFLQLHGHCSPFAYGVPRLALGLSVPAPSHLTTCNHPHGRILSPTVPSPCFFGNRFFTLGHYAWRLPAPPTSAFWAPTLWSVLPHRRLLPALECVPPEGCLPSRGSAPSPFGALASFHLRLGDLSSLLTRFSTPHTLGPSD